MMKKYNLITLLLLLFFGALSAQYNEKQILTQQASQFMVTRQYDRAEEIYLEILDKFPNDVNTVLQLMQLYLNIGNKDKAEQHLNFYQRYLADNQQMELRMQLLLMQGKAQEAERIVAGYLELYGQHSSRHRLIASYYERYRYYEEAIDIYQAARAQFGGDLFALEIGNAAMKIQRFHQATDEYLNYIAASTGVNYFIKSQIASMLKRDESIIERVKQASEKRNSEVITELYGASLIELERYDEALEIYKGLNPSFMRNFAQQQRKLRNYNIAIQAYQFLADIAEKPIQRLTYDFDIATIYHEDTLYDSCDQKLTKLLADDFWAISASNTRTGLYFMLRKLKAENDTALGVDFSEIVTWLQESKRYVGRARDNQELDLAIAKISILNEDYANGEKALARITMPDFKEDGDYLKFLLQFYQNNVEQADELMHGFLIAHPESEYANDIIYLNMLAINMNDSQSESFGASVRKLQLYKEEGITELRELFEQTGDEELLILAIEWALRMGLSETASELLEHEFEDELASDYAQYFRLVLISDREEEKDFARDYLKLRPNSIFSPRFRQSLTHGNDPELNI
ncbi:MAG: tetratricopeptide repeat protein [Candidatus Cloacimonetes bacterium]|nr:tetratricopeptide repeat protein [Candidatus Cloacimonadota bacterium]